MWGYRRNNLRDTDYKNSVTYKKYFKYVGKLVCFRAWIGHAKDEKGEMIRDEQRNYVSIWEDRLYLISSVIPQKYYSNRYAFKMVACGKHSDIEEGAAGMVAKFNTNAWKIME